MDDIAACIKDHQYNEAIRKTVVSPEEALARAILDKVPKPPKTMELVPQKDFASKFTLDKVAAGSLGRYFLAECLLEVKPDTSAKAVEYLQVAMNAYSDYISGKRPSAEDADGVKQAFAKCSKHLKTPSADEVTAVTTKIQETDFVAAESDELVALFDPLVEALKTTVLKEAYDHMCSKEEVVKQFQEVTWYKDRPVTMNDFVVFRDLGRGAFGVVSGARHRVTGQMVALKGMNRKLVKGKKVLKMVKAEFKILKALGEKPSPFCVSLRYSFMDPTDLYLGLPLCTGGDLMYHLRSNRSGFGVERSRFFAAEIVLAIEHLHKLGILYRDLKPENVLLEDTGHTKISDMGLAIETGFTPKTIGSKTFTGKAGTPGYWPPEMIKKEGYAFDADWWSFGVMLYEFLVGICAFSESHTKCKDRNEATLTWVIQFPSTSGTSDPFPEEAKDLILKLLDRNRETRVGAKPDAVEQIKRHPFFKDIDWPGVATLKTAPPWTPPADSINAASQEEIQERSKEHEFKKLKLTDEDNIEGINYSSSHHERDLVTVLKLDKKGKLKHLDQGISSTCNIL